jgi:hypothetical protein
VALPSTINDREYGAFVESGSGIPAKRVVLYDAAGAALLVAAALADGAANPTVPGIGAYGLLWNGSTWDRASGANTDGSTGVQKVQLVTPAGNRIDGSSGQTDANTGIRMLMASQWGYNGATYDRLRAANKVIDIASTAITAGTPLTIWTPAAGKKFRLMGWQLSSSAATSLIFKYAAGSTLLFRSPTLTAAGVWDTPPGFGNGQMPGAANDVLKLDCVANSTVAGFIFGCEE